MRLLLVKGVESNYTDGDHVSVYWGYRDEIRDSYFSNAFLHTPGTYDSDIQLALKTSATLVENNILARTHVSIMFEWGAAETWLPTTTRWRVRQRRAELRHWRN